MSHIFDALQRSEAERSGAEQPAVSVATELLQAAERKTVALRANAGEGAPVALDFDPVIELARAAETPVIEPAPQQVGQFQTLKVLVPPQSRLVCLTDKESLAAEKFRFLGVRLRQLRQNRQLRRVLITSTMPQEGKSMVAANLACTLARRTQQRTLLLEGDLRRPSQAQLFGVGKVPGITECLQGQRDLASSIYYLEEAGVWILPAGKSPHNPLELMQSGRLATLMDQLNSWFDWIVIDSPPVLPLADTSVWMRLADGVLLVTRREATEKKQLLRGLEAIENSKLIGALLNSSIDVAHADYYQRYAPNVAATQDVTVEK